MLILIVIVIVVIIVYIDIVHSGKCRIRGFCRGGECDRSGVGRACLGGRKERASESEERSESEEAHGGRT